jgi:hypothetical protein
MTQIYMSGEPIRQVKDLQPGDIGYVRVVSIVPELSVLPDRIVYPKVNTSMGKCYKVSCTETGLSIELVSATSVSTKTTQCCLITHAPAFMESQLSMQEKGWKVIPATFNLVSSPDGVVFAGAFFQKEVEDEHSSSA